MLAEQLDFFLPPETTDEDKSTTDKIRMDVGDLKDTCTKMRKKIFQGQDRHERILLDIIERLESIDSRISSVESIIDLE